MCDSSKTSKVGSPFFPTSKECRAASALSRAQSGKRAVTRHRRRSEDLVARKFALGPAIVFHRVAECHEEMRLHRCAERLRGPGMSMAHNIALAPDSTLRQEFIPFPSIARRSLIDGVPVLLVLEMPKLDEAAKVYRLLGSGSEPSSKPTGLLISLWLKACRLLFSPSPLAI